MSDPWAEWLLLRRFAGSEEVRREFMEHLTKVREKVLDNAEIAGGEVLLDVGCGDGLIGVAGLERGVRTVVFCDISEELLNECRTIAADLGMLDRCRFVQAAAEDLGPIEAASVDVVTTRSVLIYVKDKQRAFEEFFRVLRPGGRISLFEPINRLSNFFTTYDVTLVQDLADRVRAVFERIQPPEDDPMLDFDERDLVNLAEHAGFTEIYLHLETEVKPPEPRPWETFLRIVGNPKIPSFGEAMNEALTPEERDRLTAQLRPLVEAGRGRRRMTSAFLWAVKGEY